MNDLPQGAAKAQKSHLWERHPEDWYVEERGCTTALLKAELFTEGEIYDPACGMGRICDEAQAFYPSWLIHGSDLIVRSKWCREPVDFTVPANGPIRAWNIISNPPFKLCGKREDFVFLRNGLLCARVKSAFLLPADWKNSKAAAEFCEQHGLYRIYDLVPRPSMPPGPVVEAGEKVGQGIQDYSWFVFLNGYRGPAMCQPLFWERVK